MHRRLLAQVAVGAGLALAATFAPAQGQTMVYVSGLCGTLNNAYGPYDYRTVRPDRKKLVEGSHFVPSVESLRKGNRSREIGGDIDYTLRAMPNHPRALSAMARLGKKEGKTQVGGAHYPVECYFDRAMRFAPDDPWPKVLYAFFLIDNNREKEARTYLDKVEVENPSDPQIAYNLGLAYYDLGEFEKAKKHATQAYDNGIQFPALREKLEAKKNQKN